ncbi:hypothetical protein [Deinococcus pimensis]|uniref:hypothetical protein n=1 Tax=Deinococcus pimensis TaxID=309888 RepID=UPI0004B7171F|nr:hypothetical protein [Deinococcus pimensis]
MTRRERLDARERILSAYERGQLTLPQAQARIRSLDHDLPLDEADLHPARPPRAA